MLVSGVYSTIQHRFFEVLVCDLQITFSSGLHAVPQPGTDNMFREIVTQFGFSTRTHIVKRVRTRNIRPVIKTIGVSTQITRREPKTNYSASEYLNKTSVLENVI